MFNKAATHAKVVVPPTNSKNSLCENNACTFVLTVLSGDFSMTLKIIMPVTSCHASRESPYMLGTQEVSDIHPPLGFCCI